MFEYNHEYPNSHSISCSQVHFRTVLFVHVICVVALEVGNKFALSLTYRGFPLHVSSTTSGVYQNYDSWLQLQLL